MVMLVEKLNGEIENFDKNKIFNSVTQAFISVDKNKEELQEAIKSIVENIEKEIIDRFSTIIPNVENINDIVEKNLMKEEFFDVAKNYIIYRAEKKRKIEEERKDTNFLKKLTIIKSTNKKVLFSVKKMKSFLKEICEEFPEIDHEFLFDNLAKTLYDGIKTEDIIKSLIFIVTSYIEKDPAYSYLASKLFLIKLRKEIFDKSSDYESDLSDELYRDSFIDSIKIGVSKGIFDKRLLKFDLKYLASKLDISRDKLFKYMGIQTLHERYLAKVDGTRLELPQSFWMRIAMGLSLLETNKEEKAIEFYEYMSKMYYIPSTPTLFNSGTVTPQLASCYLNNVEDDLKKIYKVYGDNAQLSKWSGGIGTSWTKVRGTGSFINKTKVNSQGVIPFLKIANDSTVAINRSGKRRGAAAVYLENWHLDFEDFVDLRRNTGDERRRCHDLNTVSWIPDLFMKRMLENKHWTLFSPDETGDLHESIGREFETKYVNYEKLAKEGKIKKFKTLEADKLWKKMLNSLFETGHPWNCFKDPCNIRSPQNHVGFVHNSNLCTEIIENTSEDEVAVCNLLSLNLSKIVKNKKIDYDLLKSMIHTAIRSLDNTIDLNFYPIEEAKTSNFRHRPVGLGVMGIQDLLYMLDLIFESEETAELMDTLFEFISYESINASCELAKERGQYSTFKGSKWDQGIFPLDTLDLVEEERGMKIDIPRTTRLPWDSLKKKVKEFGMRNSLLMAIAPTATISTIAGCYPCIEPIYKNLYTKDNMSGIFTILNEYLINDLKKLNLWNKTMLDKIKYYDGSIAKIPEIPDPLKLKYREVFEIDPFALINLTAIRGKWIDQSQSHNIFLKTKNGKLVSDLYIYAWKKALKTTYYFRSLGATQIEKSTLDSSFTSTQSRDEAEQVKSCLLNDPTCESCQ